MGWICITDECTGSIDSDTGIWDGSGMAYFSIAEEITILHDVFFEFLLGLSGSFYVVGVMIMVITLVVSVMIGIRRSMTSAIR